MLELESLPVGEYATNCYLLTLPRDRQRTVFTWPDDTLLYPGHGDPTTVGAERPAFQKFLACPRSQEMCRDVTWG